MNNYKINQLFFKSIILLICSYKLDKNKNHKSYLSNEKIDNIFNCYYLK